MHRFRRVMVALKMAEWDATLVRHAAMLADLGWVHEVHFVHVSSRGAREQALARVRETVRAEFPFISQRLAVKCEVVQGPPLDALLEYAAEHGIDVALLGTAPDPGRRGILGRRMAMKAPCSVWVIPGGAYAEVKRIMVPLDFSRSSSDALEVALSLARKTRARECLAVHVYFNEAVATYDEYDEVLRGREREAYQRFVEGKDLGGVTVSPVFVEGAVVAHVIERVAAERGADLIAMSTRGRSRSAAILLGSVTDQVLAETRFPVLVIKHFGARLGLLETLLDKKFRRRSGPQFD